jgi:hypothetical protein
LQVCQLRELSSVAGRIARTWAYCVGCLTVLGQVVLATGARAARGGATLLGHVGRAGFRF